jgi:signal transduction histidine kinase
LRLRYFLITSIVLLFVSLFSLWAHNYTASKDQVTNIVTILKQTATTLQQIDWANSSGNDLQRIEFILKEELGDSQLNRFFIMRDQAGQVFYKSDLVSILKLEDIATSPTLLHVIKNDSEIRVYNITDQRFPDKILQVGLIHPNSFGKEFTKISLLTLFFSIGALGILSSWLLSGVLFSPIKEVGAFLSSATIALDRRGVLPSVPQELFTFLGKKDELRLLTENLNSLLNKINQNYKTSRLWGAQMAHELKTPLSQLLLHIESTSDVSSPATQKSFAYIYSIKNTIDAFLDWAELENSGHSQQKYEDIPVPLAVRGVVSMLTTEEKERIQLHITEELVVHANINHLSQIVSNLLSNALKYSDGKINIEISRSAIRILDHGQGIPYEVLEKIGDPFNFGNSKLQKKGHGLGLAWVKTICNLYGWKLNIESNDRGTKTSIKFSK